MVKKNLNNIKKLTSLRSDPKIAEHIDKAEYLFGINVGPEYSITKGLLGMTALEKLKTIGVTGTAGLTVAKVFGWFDDHGPEKVATSSQSIITEMQSLNPVGYGKVIL